MSGGRAGTCPVCGAPLVFAVGRSRAAVCGSCKALVARRDQDFEKVGQVAELIPTGTRLALGATGQFEGDRFEIIGRLQMEWSSGVWDEWYVAFDGAVPDPVEGAAPAAPGPRVRWGWLAEAQGRYYFTLPRKGTDLPALAAVKPGKVALRLGKTRLVAVDVKQAKIVTCEGELPDEVEPGAVVRSVDLEGPDGAFGTIDYGAPGDEPKLFFGKRRTLKELQIKGGKVLDPAVDAPEGLSLSCGNCGAPVTLRVPDQTVRVVCEACHALLEHESGALRLLEILKRHGAKPPIPLGRKGTLRGAEVVVVGWIEWRSLDDSWEDLLLYNPETTDFSWLVLGDGHWALSTPISAGDVTAGAAPVHRGKAYRRFSSGTAEVDEVLGELYWKVAVGDSTEAVDYIAPPEGLSCERSDGEVNWSHLTYLQPGEVAEAFGEPDIAKGRRIGVGALQPWPYEDLWRGIWRWGFGAIAAAFVLAFVFVSRSDNIVVRQSLTPAELSAQDPTIEPNEAVPNEGKVHTFLSEPFVLSGNRALEVRIEAEVSNSWAYVEGGIVEEETGETSLFGLETAYYYGVEDGEGWSEGNRSATADLPAPRRGSYVLRADVHWDPTHEPPAVHIQVREGGLSGYQFLLLLAVIGAPLLLGLHKLHIEKKRWEK